MLPRQCTPHPPPREASWRCWWSWCEHDEQLAGAQQVPSDRWPAAQTAAAADGGGGGAVAAALNRCYCWPVWWPQLAVAVAAAVEVPEWRPSSSTDDGCQAAATALTASPEPPSPNCC